MTKKPTKSVQEKYQREGDRFVVLGNPLEILAQIEALDKERALRIAQLKAGLYQNRHDPSSGDATIREREHTIKKAVGQLEHAAKVTKDIAQVVKRALAGEKGYGYRIPIKTPKKTKHDIPVTEMFGDPRVKKIKDILTWIEASAQRLRQNAIENGGGRDAGYIGYDKTWVMDNAKCAEADIEEAMRYYREVILPKHQGKTAKTDNEFFDRK